MVSILKYLLLPALFVTGCTQEYPDNETQKAKYFSLDIQFGENNITRAGTDNLHPLGKTKIHDAGIYFYRGASRKILMYYSLTTADINALNSGSGTVHISNVPNISDNLFFVANYSASTGKPYPYSNEPSPGQGIDAITGATITTASQMKTTSVTHSAEYVVMSGKARIEIDPAKESEFKRLSLTIAPLVARLEIGGLKARYIGTSIAPGDIVGYTVSGIYINKYYFKTNLLGEHRIGDYQNTIFPVDNEQDVPKYSGSYDKQETDPFPPYKETQMFIEPAIGTANSDQAGMVTAGTGKVWAFQLFESNPVHIIIRLDNILYSEDMIGTPTSTSPITGATGEQYLTIQRYKEDRAGGHMISTFERGKVYRMGNIPFTAADVGNPPYTKTQYFVVSVSVAKWAEASINVDYN